MFLFGLYRFNINTIKDINKKSKTFLQWKCTELSENESLSLFIGKGYAHGFLTLKKNTVVFILSTFRI